MVLRGLIDQIDDLELAPEFEESFAGNSVTSWRAALSSASG
jgi:hypothetical protein